MGEDRLVLNGAVKAEAAPELALQSSRIVHVPGSDMHRVEQVDADVEQVIEQRVNVRSES